MESNTAIARLAALAQDSRLAIYRLLIQNAPQGLCVSEIAARTGLAPATLSFHLKELTRAGLLNARQQGRFIYYAPRFEAMDELVAYLMENCCGGAACASRCAPNPEESMS